MAGLPGSLTLSKSMTFVTLINRGKKEEDVMKLVDQLLFYEDVGEEDEVQLK